MLAEVTFCGFNNGATAKGVWVRIQHETDYILRSMKTTDTNLVFHNMHFWQICHIDLWVDFYSLLLFVLIIWQYTHNLANTRNIK